MLQSDSVMIRSANTAGWCLCGLYAMAGLGCGPAPAPTVTDVPVKAAPAAPVERPSADESTLLTTTAEEKEFAGVAVTVPAGWEVRKPTSEFILAEYRLPGKTGPGRLTMSSAGGGVEANIDRWRGQFTRGPNDPPMAQNSVDVRGGTAQVVELFGTFRDGFSGGGPQSDWAMFGAVIPTGPANFFIKLTGPRETLQEQREVFQEFVKSARLVPQP